MTTAGEAAPAMSLWNMCYYADDAAVILQLPETDQQDDGRHRDRVRRRLVQPSQKPRLR